MDSSAAPIGSARSVDADRDAEFAALAAEVVDEVEGELIDLLSALGAGRRRETPRRPDAPPALPGERVRTADVVDLLRELGATERATGSVESVRPRRRG